LEKYIQSTPIKGVTSTS